MKLLVQKHQQTTVDSQIDAVVFRKHQMDTFKNNLDSPFIHSFIHPSICLSPIHPSIIHHQSISIIHQFPFFHPSIQSSIIYLYHPLMHPYIYSSLSSIHYISIHHPFINIIHPSIHQCPSIHPSIHPSNLFSSTIRGASSHQQHLLASITSTTVIPLIQDERLQILTT